MTDRLGEIRTRWEPYRGGPLFVTAESPGGYKSQMPGWTKALKEAIAHAPEDIDCLLRIAEAAELFLAAAQGWSEVEGHPIPGEEWAEKLRAALSG